MPARLRPGDIFEVELDGGRGYFQYVGRDATQLQSDVVQALAARHTTPVQPEELDLSRGATAFFSHVMLNAGVKRGFWQRVGHAAFTEPSDVLFRDSSDYGNPEVKVSRNWLVWTMNRPQVFVGPLTGRNREAEIGIVVPPDSLVHRMRTGRYDFVYPAFE